MEQDYQEQLGQFQNEVEKFYRWNFCVSIIDGSNFAFGMGLTSMYTILTLFVINLTSSKILLSLVTTITMLGTYLPQIFVANYVERVRYKKPVSLFFGLFQRLPWLGLALFVYFYSDASAAWLLIGFFFFYGIYSFGGGLTIPPWYDLTVKTIPPTKLGRYFGYRSFACGVMEFIGASLAGVILKSILFPHNFAVLFVLTFIFTGISYVLLALVKEPDYPLVKERVKMKDYFRSLPVILHQNRNFRLYIIALIFIQFYVMGNVLYTASAIEGLRLNQINSGLQVGIFTAFMLGFQTVSFPIWGHLSDRWGHRQIIAISAGLNVIAAIFAGIGHHIVLYYLVFIFAGVSQGASRISLMAILPEFCSPNDRPTYLGLTNSVSGLIFIIASLAGGVLADLFNYRIAFGVTSLLVGTGLWILLTQVRDPQLSSDS